MGCGCYFFFFLIFFFLKHLSVLFFSLRVSRWFFFFGIDDFQILESSNFDGDIGNGVGLLQGTTERARF